MPAVDIANMATLIDERYREVEVFLLSSEDNIIPDLYTVKTSDRNTERKSSVGEFGSWPVFSGELSYDRPYEGYNVSSVHLEYAVGMRLTETMLEDDLSGVWEAEDFEAMARAGMYTRQTDATRLLQLATTNDTTFYTRSEGLPLASNSHTTRVPGVDTSNGFDNLVTTALTPVSYRAARIQMRKFRNDRGQLINLIGDELWVPVDQEPRAQEILQSSQYADSAENRINPEKGTATVKTAIQWTDTNNWSLMNSSLRKKMCTWWERVPIAYRTIGDFETFQVKTSGRGRWSPMVLDWRFMLYASVG